MIRFYLLSQTPTTHLVRDRATDMTVGHFTYRGQAEAFCARRNAGWNPVTRVTSMRARE